MNKVEHKQFNNYVKNFPRRSQHIPLSHQVPLYSYHTGSLPQEGPSIPDKFHLEKQKEDEMQIYQAYAYIYKDIYTYT